MVPPVVRIELSHGLDASDLERFAHCRMCDASRKPGETHAARNLMCSFLSRQLEIEQ
jgi:hypothetical protein